MAALTLNKVWLNRLDTGEAVSSTSLRSGRGQKWTNTVEARRYAGGRIRAVSVAGEMGEVTFPLSPVTGATVATLRSWKGVTVQYRDHRGQKFFGVFADVDVSEYLPATMYIAAITLMVLTTTQEV